VGVGVGWAQQDKEYEIGYLEHYITYCKERELAEEMKKYKTKTLRISETKKEG
jgi:hypothetical protein